MTALRSEEDEKEKHWNILVWIPSSTHTQIDQSSKDLEVEIALVQICGKSCLQVEASNRCMT